MTNPYTTNPDFIIVGSTAASGASGARTGVVVTSNIRDVTTTPIYRDHPHRGPFWDHPILAGASELEGVDWHIRLRHPLQGTPDDLLHIFVRDSYPPAIAAALRHLGIENDIS